MAYATCFRYCILNEAYSVDSYLKPSLTYDQKKERVRWVLSRLLWANAAISTFDRMLNRIHVDEMCFFLVPVKRKFRRFPGNDYPGDDTTHHMSHIPKIMFLAAIGVPHQRPDGSYFVGKIGIWAFTEQVAAQ